MKTGLRALGTDAAITGICVTVPVISITNAITNANLLITLLVFFKRTILSSERILTLCPSNNDYGVWSMKIQEL